MIGPELPEIPQSLKSIQHYLRIAAMHDQRDPVVSYWCRLYALQTGLKLSSKTPKETNFLMKLMDWLEACKKELRDNEAITNDVAAQAHLENWALKLFLNADKNDRASNFGKNVIQSFFTAGLLYDVLTVFGELSEEATQNRKYAKWKAAYIHNCLKNNEIPVPGPPPEENRDDEMDKDTEEGMGPREESNADDPVDIRDAGPTSPTSPTRPSGDDATRPGSIEESCPGSKDRDTPATTEGRVRESYIEMARLFVARVKRLYSIGGIELSVEQMGRAQKLIKWAGSALNYDDVATAVSNLRKALHLLTTGQEPT